MTGLHTLLLLATLISSSCSRLTFGDYWSRQPKDHPDIAGETKGRLQLYELLESPVFSNLGLAKSLGAGVASKLNERGRLSKKYTASNTDDNVVSFNAGDKTVTEVDVPEVSADVQQCYTDVMAFVSSLKTKKEWAIRMVDSFGRPGPGILEGRVTWTGYYDECVAVAAKYQVTNGTGNDGEFKGRYCSAGLELNVPGLGKIPITGWGLCLPDSCNTEDVIELVTLAISQNKNITKYVNVTSMYCHHPLGHPPHEIAVYVLIAVIVFVVVIATLFDLILLQWPIWRLEAINRDGGDERLKDEAEALNHRDDDIALLVVNTHIKDNMYTPNMAGKFLLSFSAWSNSKKIWNLHQASGSITCVNGIRVLSISWVILGHCLFILQDSTEDVLVAAKTHLHRWTFMAIYNATYSVDSFFVLSGLLLTYLTLKEMSRSDGKINWFLFYFHRYLRLTPVYMMCLAIFAATVPYWSDGPLWKQDGWDKHNCRDSWWGNLLYVNNLVKFGKDQCFEWGWYLGVDMQFFVLSPLIIIPLYRRPIIGYIIAGFFFLVTTITPFVLTIIRRYPASFAQVKDQGTAEHSSNYELYTAPWSRMGPYIVGMITGYILYRCKCRARISRVVNLLGWAVSIAAALSVIYGLFDYADGSKKIDLYTAAVYNALSRSVWGLCVAWVIFACVTGNGGLVNSLLSMPVWVPLSRLTYVAYLIHPILLGLYAMDRQTPFFMDDMSLITLFLAALMSTFSLSFITSLAFEAPVMGIEKLIFKRDKRS